MTSTNSANMETAAKMAIAAAEMYQTVLKMQDEEVAQLKEKLAHSEKAVEKLQKANAQLREVMRRIHLTAFDACGIGAGTETTK